MQPIDGFVRYAEAGTAHLQRVALPWAFAHAEEQMGPSWGRRLGPPVVIDHLRFREAAV